ncbi:MAG: hypothetical protein WAM73_19920 [Desulfobacterales bacterium]
MTVSPNPSLSDTNAQSVKANGWVIGRIIYFALSSTSTPMIVSAKIPVADSSKKSYIQIFFLEMNTHGA